MDPLTEFRRRLDLTPAQAPDELLTHFLDVSTAAVEPWLAPDAATLYPQNVGEAVVQVAVKMWDVAARGVTQLGPDGEWTLPAASATPGLIRACFPALGPALRFGGLSM